MKKTCILSLVMVIFNSSSLHAADPQTTIKGVRGQLVRDVVECEMELTFLSGYMPHFKWNDGEISRFVDDLGTDMGTKSAGMMTDYKTIPWFDSTSMSHGKDGRLVSTYIRSPRKMQPAAKQFMIEGNIKAKFCTNQEAGEVKNISVKEGVEFSLGTHKARISRAARKEEVLNFEVKFIDPPESFDLKEISLLDASGERIHWSFNTTRYTMKDQPPVFMLTFSHVKTQQDVVTFKYEFWENLQDVTLPFNVTVPIGNADSSSARPVKVVSRQAPAVPKPVTPPVVKPIQPVQAPSTTPALETVKPASEVTAGWPALKIGGIMGKGKSSMVLINSKVLSVGEKISGVSVISISDNTVTLKYQDQTVTLKPRQSVP